MTGVLHSACSMSSFYISAPHKSSGKTTLSIGITSAIRQRGLSVQTFKKGPDYIDPIWLSQASGQDCHNLDFYTSSRDFIQQQFKQYCRQSDAILVEGNMGLFDGLSLDGSDSNAAMAKLLNLPVILVVDTTGSSRGIAPLLNGYQAFDSELQYAGVILNKLAGSRHQSKLTQVIQYYTDFTILGAVPKNNDGQVTERHLGLIPSNEIAEQSNEIIRLLAKQANDYIDIDALLSLDTPSTPQSPIKFSDSRPSTHPIKSTTRIAVAMDEAFGFYYPGDLQEFTRQGVEIVPFSCTLDSKLPVAIDGLFIGGGFPESRPEKLSSNKTMLDSIKQAIVSGLPSYAECGGLMYLCSRLTQDDQSFPLCDVIPASVSMNKKPQGRGYITLESTASHPWLSSQPQQTIKGHEFHYSALHGLPQGLDYAYTVKRGAGIDGFNDGIVMYNLVASYAHLRHTDECHWVADFVSFVNKCKLQSEK